VVATVTAAELALKGDPNELYHFEFVIDTDEVGLHTLTMEDTSSLDLYVGFSVDTIQIHDYFA
jgi:hypothetical protein